MSQTTICLMIFVFMIVIFFIKKIPMSFSAMLVVLLLVFTGCVAPKDALSSFASNTVITMASMFVVAAGLTRTQMINKISSLLYKVTEGSFTKVLATYVLITCLLGQFVPSIVALFALVYPLVQNMCDRMKISPSKMMFPVAIASVSTAFIIEPIGPYAAWYVTQNGYLESYGWTATQLNMWSETSVLLPVGIVTILLAIFVVPKLLPDQPDVPITAAANARQLQEKEPLSPVREFLGYAVFIAVIIGLMAGLTSWEVTLAGAVVLVVTGVLTEREAVENLNMPTILLYVGVTVLGTGLAGTGAADALGGWLGGVLGGVHNGFVIDLAFYVVAFIMTSLLYNRAVSTVLIPLAVIACGSMGCDPRGPVIMCALASMSSLITPLSTAVVPMAMNAGGYSMKTIFKAGIVPGIIRGLIGAALAALLFPTFG
ncbi:MAG: anion permease [Lachnospiraceae bacterium]|jgi:di/tricarboxylate transporter|nr:anion permease [Lachnospiraceae bacterium]MCH4069923.1 anion permease [Lachnospiraceae bacterium]MCH4108726.1 anion permease [Lachnospiraceae bacterium]MCI1332416.1 anion permease [Lachnospiraceae bacterium]MCI1361803.1 anion permease [Lachnospiraceae bacterium]